MKKLAVIFLMICFAVPYNKSLAGSFNIVGDDSCTEQTTVFNTIASTFSTGGAWVAYSAAFSMTPVDDCAASNSVMFKFTYIVGSDGEGKKASSEGTADTDGLQTDTYTFSHGDTHFWIAPPAMATALNYADQICVYFYTTVGLSPMGCKYRPDPTTTTTPTSCYAGQSCGGGGDNYSLFLIPMTSKVVQCVMETLAVIFQPTGACSGNGETMIQSFENFQDSMRQAVRLALIIYVILFGMKVALGSDMPNKSEVFMFFTKFILVTYFSIGLPSSSNPSGYDNGITDYIQPWSQTLPIYFSDLVFSGGGNATLCNFDLTSYQSGYDYLALWDSIDCRVAIYLNIFEPSSSDMSNGFFVLPLIAFFSFQIIFALFSLMFGIFFLSVVVYFVNVYILCVITVAVLVFLAPLFVPFALFNFTKGYFDSWMRLIISYILQPMILAAFMALMLTVFDSIMYGDCTFSQISSLTYNGKTGIFYQVDSSSDTSCTQTFGYSFAGFIKDGTLAKKIEALFFSYNVLNPQVSSKLYGGLLQLVLFAVLFYSFLDSLSQFAADITGGTNLGKNAISPKEIMNRAFDGAKAAAKYAMGDSKGAAKDATKAAVGKNTVQNAENKASGAVSASQNNGENGAKGESGPSGAGAGGSGSSGAVAGGAGTGGGVSTGGGIIEK